ncbi:flagellin [Cellulomonas sp. ACRRI]|uniref:flagellin N-terminal helical domain-containing protein n=1 Tax=unclassified Cellulomonas TaxID=2620175 RepID=UPI00142183D1|nr:MULTISPECIES: flagellin [unclassified Cellulomonas]MCG7287275.1 flagellin [Cellulomonas sp. ACRRI]NHT16641.1 flagellin [Cellulomonas sp. IC4_254]
MALSINQNIAALNSYRNLSNTQNDLSKSLEKLSSGLRINRAADDAAGLAISEGLRAQIGGTKQAVRNAQDGISVVQTAEGALTETHSILQRMRTLSVQAANDGGLSETAKGNIQDEMDQLKTELTRISDTTQFNGTKLLDGNYSGTFQVGANTSDQDKITVDLKRTGGLSATGLDVNGIDVTKVASDASTAVVTNAVAGTAGSVAVTADTTDLEALKALNGTVTVGSKSFDLASVDYAGVTDAAGALAAITAAAAKVFGTSVTVAAAGTTGVSFTGATPAATATASEVAAASPVFSQKSGATEAIDKIDAAITDVSKVRSQLGAVQNRFDHTINNLNVAVENLTSSESRIRDTDMASEMVSFTRAQILSQAGTAMLAQAKSIPQSVLQLLQ